MEYRVLASSNIDERNIATALVAWCRQLQLTKPLQPSLATTVHKPLPVSNPPHSSQSAKPNARPTSWAVPGNITKNENQVAQEFILVNSEIRLQKMGNGGGKQQNFFHWRIHRLLTVNLRTQQSVWHTITGSMSGREGAVLGTEGFKPGTVGYGVNMSIASIRFLGGDYGQAKIGELFNRPDVQELLAKPNTTANNRQMAELEYQYWQHIKDSPLSSVEDRRGGIAGTTFNPFFRTYIQLSAGGVRQGYHFVDDEIIDPITGTIGAKYNSLKNFAQKRLDQLQDQFRGL